MSSHLERASLEGVDGESDDLIARNIQVDHGFAIFARGSLACPPVGSGAVIKARVFFSEDLSRSGHEFAAGREDESRRQKGGEK